ncbi:transcriptional regulator GcvA [Elioraea sp.]|uniref:transcriptional regulator GcvA n=1 Tax=Elioraea sp. TaxID=2185103 RepID=UPI0025BBB6CB|nr:transcriptional regulator GcvA [Elioraea sp.]
MIAIIDENSSSDGRRLPPLNALRAFEAAARHASFTLAGAELCVTAGAVSRQILLLEAHLGVRLFKRQHRSVSLTRAGETYLDGIRTAFDQIAAATARLVPADDERLLRLKLPPTFAIRWLIPRLASLHARDGTLSVQITTSHDAVDFDREDVDAAVQWIGRPPRGVEGERLFGEVLVPVCSPRFPMPQGGFSPTALAREVLMHSIQRPRDWPRWFDAAGVRDQALKRTMIFQNSSLTYQGAIEGLGIAIAQLAFVHDELKTGRLVEAHPLKAPTDMGYVLTYPRAKARLRKVRLLRDWLAEEGAATERLHGAVAASAPVTDARAP